MKYKSALKLFLRILSVFFLATTSGYAQMPNLAMAKQVQAMENARDYSGIEKLIGSEESVWKTAPKIAYFQNMFSIADVLTDGTTPNMYWLGRRVLWQMLSKSAPNEYLSASKFYLWRYSMLFSDAEKITPYVENLSPEMFSAVRHDTFLMLSEYVRQLHSTIIPGYHDKYTGGVEGMSEHMQSAIDNELQRQSKIAISLLGISNENIYYLIDAYSHDPRNDDELKALLGILNVQDADRAKVMQDTR
jgi:hypothetical protein